MCCLSNCNFIICQEKNIFDWIHYATNLHFLESDIADLCNGMMVDMLKIQPRSVKSEKSKEEYI